MYEYYIKFLENDMPIEFNSIHHIATMTVSMINGASIINFEDVSVTINLAYIEKVKINGEDYQLQDYIM
ncbi:MAG: hypothetical protein RR440_00230 [Erysipelotrichaceae bacterium]